MRLLQGPKTQLARCIAALASHLALPFCCSCAVDCSGCALFVAARFSLPPATGIDSVSLTRQQWCLAFGLAIFRCGCEVAGNFGFYRCEKLSLRVTGFFCFDWWATSIFGSIWLQASRRQVLWLRVSQPINAAVRVRVAQKKNS